MIWRVAYRVFLWLSLPAVLVRLWRRGRDESGYRHAIGERFGFYSRQEPEAQLRNTRPLIWLHAVSVGETRAAEPLLRALLERYPGHRLLLTHMTATGREAAQQLVGPASDVGSRVSLAWLPYDYPSAMRRFLRHFKPVLGVIMETEIWFNLLRECARAGMPVMLANARLSEQSARGYGMVMPLMREALGHFAALAVQTAEDAKRLAGLGANAAHITVTGNLKFDAPLPEAACGDGLRAGVWSTMGSRPVLLAASTREGEEELLLDALRSHPLPGNALLVIVPRHPQRFDQVARLIAERGLRFARRSAMADASTTIADDCAILLGDSMGEMPGYYRAADCAFIGGSLLPLGGQNLIEACAIGVPVLVGPHTYNFAEAAEEAVAAGAVLRVKDADDLVLEAGRLLSNEKRRRQMSVAGLAFVQAHRGATARTLAICERLLE